MDAQAKQQVVEKVKPAANVLVTVSRNPSVDQLAACIGLTLLLNKMGKHATAVFSGQVPSTIEFLQPEKTIETNTDSLRDFIISLDKAKADKLRYKVEDQFVRIFITPYRSSLSEKDLTFEQGDFNVEVVMALGVSSQDQLDEAITAHGKILHDAAVIAINTGQAKGQSLGQINWIDPAASSLSEMIVSISEAFGPNLIDAQMATAFLTGIVAETDRYSNTKTSPKVMTMSAQLMAAGANQQLIASKLEPPEAPPPAPTAAPAPVTQAQWQKAKPAQLEESKKAKDKADGTLSVDHKTDNASDEVSIPSSEIRIDQEGNLKKAAELEKARQAAQKAPVSEPSIPAAPPADKPVPVTTDETKSPEAEPKSSESSESNEKTDEAEMPGSHTMMSKAPLMESPFSATGLEEDAATSGTASPAGFIGHAPDIAPPPEPKFNMPSEVPPATDQARSAVDKAYESASDNPAAEAMKGVAPPSSPSNTGSTAPPPFPPPLTPAQGVVIPPPPYTPPKNDDNTL